MCLTLYGMVSIIQTLFRAVSPFIYVLFLLAMGYKGFLGLKDRPKKQYLSVLLGVVGFIILAEKLEASYTGTAMDSIICSPHSI